jgi:hypothetical protein
MMDEMVAGKDGEWKGAWHMAYRMANGSVQRRRSSPAEVLGAIEKCPWELSGAVGSSRQEFALPEERYSGIRRTTKKWLSW